MFYLFPWLTSYEIYISLTYFYMNNLFADNVDVGNVMPFWWMACYSRCICLWWFQFQKSVASKNAFCLSLLGHYWGGRGTILKDKCCQFFCQGISGLWSIFGRKSPLFSSKCFFTWKYVCGSYLGWWRPDALFQSRCSSVGIMHRFATGSGADGLYFIRKKNTR